MTEQGDDSEPQGDPSAVGEVPLWARAAIEDFEGFDFESPIAELSAADCYKLCEAYNAAAKLYNGRGDEDATGVMRVFHMLEAITGFLFKPHDRNAPYAPFMEAASYRSASVEDFRGEPILALVYAANHAKSPVLKARLCDVCWLLEPRRFELGGEAVSSYVEILVRLDSGILDGHRKSDDATLGLDARNYLQRALAIGCAIGWEKPEVAPARDWVRTLRARAMDKRNLISVHWFFQMDVEYRVSVPSELAAELEEFLQQEHVEARPRDLVPLWRLAARSYHGAGNSEGEIRCRTAAAEAFVAEATSHSSAMLQAHWFESALQEYHGVPGAKARRKELRQKLVNSQPGVRDEMMSFSHSVDVSDIVSDVIEDFNKEDDLLSLLFMFSDICKPPSPEELSRNAADLIENYPLSSVFGTAFIDNDGKVLARSNGGGLRDDKRDSVIRAQIAQDETLRRKLVVESSIEIARRNIISRYYIGIDTFNYLLCDSAFVPPDVIYTYSRGFARFFEGDHISATYILTPMLEKSLRHVLKLCGYDVSKFDDARLTQEDRTISALFDQMRSELEGVFGRDLIADIDRVFLSKPGPSLRHALAHGLLNDGSPYGADAIYGCWLIFRLCCAPLWKFQNDIVLPS